MIRFDRLRDPRLWLALAEVMFYVADSINLAINRFTRKKGQSSSD